MSVVFIHEACWLQTVVLPIKKKHLLAIWASWIGELQLEKSDHAFVVHRLGTNQKPRLLRRRLTRSKKAFRRPSWQKGMSATSAQRDSS